MPGRKPRLAYSLAALAAMVAMQSPLAVAAQFNKAPTQSGRIEHNGRHDQSEHKRHAHSQSRDIAFMIPGYGPIGQKTLESLVLTDSQKQKINVAQTEQQALVEAHRNSMQLTMQTRLVQLQEGAIDPRAALQAMNTAREEMAQRRLSVAGKWLQAWEALDADQQKVLTQALADRYEHRKEKMQRHFDS